MKPTLNLALSFAAGALAVWFLSELATQRRMQAHLVSAATLQEQVRSRIAELVSHPAAITVTVEGGLVRVSGDVLSNEIDVLLLELTRMRGVHKVHNALSATSDSARFDARRGATGATGEVDEVQS